MKTACKNQREDEGRMKKKRKERVVTETRGGRKRSKSQFQREREKGSEKRGFAHNSYNAQELSGATSKK